MTAEEMIEPTIRDGITELGIFEKNNKAWTSSRELARVFKKLHKNVLRDIDRIIEEGVEDFNRLNFGLVKYKDGKGEMRRAYRMTRKGFTLVAMGFTGKKAMEFKVAYIEAFEDMSELIETRLLSKEGYKEMSSAVARNLGFSRHIFIREADMVNRTVLGMPSITFRKIHNLKKGETPRDAIIREKLQRLDEAQRLNANLIKAKVSEDERKRILEINFKG